MGRVNEDYSASVVEITAHVPEVRRALAALTRAGGALEHRLAELIKVRVSQINGCATCIEVHVHELREAGEHPRRVDALVAWRGSALFSPAERAALAVAEGITRIADGAPDAAVMVEARKHWTEEELALIVMNTIAINAWNRYTIMNGTPERPLDGA